jgi:hypothetical protein
MTASYRCWVATVAAPTVALGELPFSALSYNSVLNGSATASVSLPLDSFANDTMAIAPGSTVLWVERAGALVFGGIIWTMGGDVAGNSVTLNAGDFMSYYARRVLRSTLTYSGIDSHIIARGVIDAANGETDALGIVGTADTSTSGVLGSATFYGWDRKNVAGAVAQLSQVNNGFDYKLELTLPGDVPTVEFVCVSPNTGNVTAHVFDLQSNIEALSFVVSGASIVTQADALGSGAGDARVTATATEAGSQYALMQSAVSFSDVSLEASLQSHADRLLALSRSPVSAVSIDVRTDVDPAPDAYSVGDLVEVRAAKGFFTCPTAMRIVQVDVKSSGNSESVSLKLADAAAFATI